MHAKPVSLLLPAGLLTGALLALSGARAADADAFPVFDNYIIVGGLVPSTTGDANAFQARQWTAKNGAAGIEDFRYAFDPAKGTTLTFDGHALVGPADYLARFRWSKEDVASLDVGYQRFRTFYDGVGAFFPTNGYFAALADPNLFVDRSKLWAEVTFARPNAPVFTIRYTNELRNGNKDSTIWGDSDNTGIPIYSQSSLNVISATRKIVPAYLELNERHQTLSGSLRHTVGRTTFEIVVSGDRIDNLDTRYMDRYPGEVKPYPAIPATPVTLVPYTKANNETVGFDTEGIKADTLALLGKFETELNDKLSLHGGLTIQHTSADIMADREMTLVIATTTGVKRLVGGFTNNGRAPYSYTAVAGTADAAVRAADLGVDYKPVADLTISAAVKAEHRSTGGNNPVTYINTFVNQATGATTSVPVSAPNYSQIKEDSWTPELDVRYTGIARVSLYATVDYRRAPGDQQETGTSIGPAGAAQAATTTVSHDLTRENHLNAKVGFIWNPSMLVSLRGEVFSKSHRDAFYDYGSTTGDRYVLGYNFDGVKATAVIRPVPGLTSTTRYVYQVGLMDVTSISDGDGGNYDSGDCRSHQFGETIDWTPTKAFYLQGDLNVTFDTIHTSYPQAGGLANTVLHNGNNNYWTATGLAGFVVDKATDVQLQYTYYSSDNYQPALAATTLPYGASGTEYSATLGIKHKFSDRLIGTAKIGYYSSKNDTTGGFTNYCARLVYLSLDYKL